jgi:hypothetical protein
MGETVQDTNKPRSGPSVDPVSAGLLLAAAPGVGYVIAYAQEFGYAMQFRIPIELIAPQLGNVLATTAGLIVVVVLGAIVVDAYMSGRQGVPVTPLEWLLGLLMVMAVLVLLSSGGDPNQAGPTWVATALLILAPIAAIVVRAGIVRGRHWGRLQAGDRRVSRDSPVVRALMGRVGAFWFFLGIGFVVTVWIFFALGGEQARNQPDFLVSDTPTPEVELAIYGDTVVLAPFDQSKHVVLPAFDIVKIGPAPLHLRLMHLGPLKSQP